MTIAPPPTGREPSTRSSSPEACVRLGHRQIAAILAGNALEFYDFLTYAFFATQIARSLFPAAGGNALLLSLATFGAGFLARPVGGFVIGRFADRCGRKPAMLFSFGLMGVAVIGLALTPGFSQIGYWAPALALTFRLLQGFALGGEVGPSTAYLFEAAPVHRRGLYISFQYATQEVAILASGAVGLALSSALDSADLNAWGWRIAFLIGALIVPFGLLARRDLAETLTEQSDPQGGGDRRAPVAAMIAGILVIGAGTLVHYTLDYLTTFAQTVLGMSVRHAFGATLVLGASGMVANIAGGLLADRFGRKRSLLAPWLLLACAGLPCFLLLKVFPHPTTLMLCTAILSVLLGLCSAPALILVAESLPAESRASSIGLTYAIAITTFGGSAQFVVALLIRVTGNPLVPAWYMTGALLIGLCGIMILREKRSIR